MGLWYACRFHYSLAVSKTGAQAIYLCVEGAPPPEILLQVEGETFFLNTMIQTREGQFRRVILVMNMVHWNAILFLALVLITPLRIILRRWYLVLAGAAALFISQVTFFATTIYALIGQAHLALENRDRSLDEFWTWVPFLSKCASFYGPIFNPIVPFLFYLPVFLFRPRSRLIKEGSAPIALRQ